jgi:hypothetical protein
MQTLGQGDDTPQEEGEAIMTIMLSEQLNRLLAVDASVRRPMPIRRFAARS